MSSNSEFGDRSGLDGVSVYLARHGRTVLPELSGLDIEQHTGCWNRLEHRGGKWCGSAINQVPTGR